MGSSTLRWLPFSALLLLALAAGGGALRLRGAPPSLASPQVPSGLLWLEAQRLLRPPSGLALTETSPEEAPTEEELRTRAQAFALQVEQTLGPWKATCLSAFRDSVAAGRRETRTLLWSLAGFSLTLSLLFGVLTWRRSRLEADFAETLQTCLDGQLPSACPPHAAVALGPCHAALGRMLKSLQRLQVQMANLRTEKTRLEEVSRPAPAPPQVKVAPPATPVFRPVEPPLPAVPIQNENEEAYFFLDLASHKERAAQAAS